MRVAVVLGGGGAVGVAWERGLIEGLLQEGIDLRRADAIVGTSAGSLVGSMLAGGGPFDPSSDENWLPEIPMAEGGTDVAVAAQVMKAWMGMTAPTAAGCAEVGRLALQAKTASEADWIAATGGGPLFTGWPDADLRVSVVDAKTGERRLLDKASGFPHDRTVASSCAVPGLFPPITMRGARYIDGGVWSGTHADALVPDQPALVVVIAPLAKGVVVFGELMENALNDEVAALEAVGSRVLRIAPETADREAFGPDMMDAERGEAVRAFARERGAALAKSEDWGALSGK